MAVVWRGSKKRIHRRGAEIAEKKARRHEGTECKAATSGRAEVKEIYRRDAESAEVKKEPQIDTDKH